MYASKTLAVSLLCNNRCINCCAALSSKNSSSFSRASLKDKLRNFKKSSSGIKTINLTGGEPTLNTELFGIIEDISGLFPKTEISLLSNGRMFVYPDYAKGLKKLKVANLKVVVPLYAHRQDLHDAITRSRGSFRQTVQGIRNLERNNLVTEIRVIINKFNYKYLKKITEFIYDNFKSAAYLVYIAMEIGKECVKNKACLRYADFMPYLESALELKGRHTSVKLYHFPLCVIKNDFHRLIYKSIEDYKLAFLPSCSQCLLKPKCMGILKSYLHYMGAEEFQPLAKK